MQVMQRSSSNRKKDLVDVEQDDRADEESPKPPPRHNIMRFSCFCCSCSFTFVPFNLSNHRRYVIGVAVTVFLLTSYCLWLQEQSPFHNLSSWVVTRIKTSTAAVGDDDISRILAPPMDMLRRGIKLNTTYNYTVRVFTGECSCSNPKATTQCCQRRFRRAHKMGCIMSQHLFDQYKPFIRKTSDPPQYTYHVSGLPEMDYRDIYLFRDVWDSIASGFLYHQMGRECWTNPYGGPLRNRTATFGGMPQVRQWYRGISYDLDPPSQNRSLCQYLKDVSEEDGMRAYIDFIFRVHYSGPFSHWAMAQELPEVRERTRTVCFEDLGSATHGEDVINSVIDFLYNGSDHRPWSGTPPGQADAKGHKTSHNPAIRERLIKLAKDIDEKYYHGHVEWVHQTLPCQKV